MGRRASLLALLCASLLADAAAAAPIVSWDVAGSDGATAAAVVLAPFVSAADTTPVNVTPWPGGFCCFTAAADWGSGAAAPDLSKYYEFSVTADPSHQIVYQTLTLSLFRGIQGVDHGAQRWELRASHDGFASAVASFDISAAPADDQVLFGNTDISAVGTQAGTVTFRLYGFDYTSPADYSGLGNHPGPTPLTGSGSDLILGGVVVPEPATVLLLVLGLGGLAVTSRPRRALARRGGRRPGARATSASSARASPRR